MWQEDQIKVAPTAGGEALTPPAGQTGVPALVAHQGQLLATQSLDEARWLVQQFSIHAMIDLSDGLATDLRHLLEAGGVGADLLAKAVPISRAARVRARQAAGAKPPLLAALTDGEDFELLFAVPSAQAVALLDAWKKQFPALRLSCLGKITAEPGLRLRDRHGVQPLTAHGYTHFAST